MGDKWIRFEILTYTLCTLHLDFEACTIAEPRVTGRIRIRFRLQPGLRLSMCVCAVLVQKCRADQYSTSSVIRKSWWVDRTIYCIGVKCWTSGWFLKWALFLWIKIKPRHEVSVLFMHWLPCFSDSDNIKYFMCVLCACSDKSVIVYLTLSCCLFLFIFGLQTTTQMVFEVDTQRSPWQPRALRPKRNIWDDISDSGSIFSDCQRCFVSTKWQIHSLWHDQHLRQIRTIHYLFY